MLTCLGVESLDSLQPLRSLKFHDNVIGLNLEPRQENKGARVIGFSRSSFIFKPNATESRFAFEN